MIRIKISDKHGVDVYSSIKELPMEVKKKFDHFMLQDAGIGNTIEDVDTHLQKIYSFVAAQKTNDALEELNNLRFNMFSAVSEINHKSMAFACMVAGNQDFTPDGLNTLIADLSGKGLTSGMVNEVLDEVKKNLIQSENSIFRNSFQMS